HEQVHLPAVGRPPGEQAARADLHVVGVREHREDGSGANDRLVGHQAAARSSTKRTSARTGTPVAPAGPRACAPSRDAGPAMSRCPRGGPPTTPERNGAAVIAPP